ncbi:MAG: intradiol ring-cleavage dioxygenase [Phototrophicales bacterium]|nr:intradiol ring-cleavage dioxygenase [Phototrophicales bacterium]
MDLHDDDKPVGRILTRRELLKLLGGTGVALTIGGVWVQGQSGTLSPTPSPTPMLIPACVVRPELTGGPFFVDTDLDRSDIRIDPRDQSVREGIPLKLIFRVSDMTGGACLPLGGAQVDIWHCDADGVYSGVASEGTRDELWLRGYRVTDEGGIAEFITIYPGWYPGRAVHIHFKIRTSPQETRGYEFTSQLFFSEDLTDVVHAQEPYAKNGYRNVLNERDGIFRQSGELLLLDVAEGIIEIPSDADAETTPEVITTLEGYVAVFDIGLDLS